MAALTIHILTLFPGIIDSFVAYGIIKRAIENDLVRIRCVNIRDFADDRHKTVDDTPYGGGSGMIMKPDVLAKSLKSARTKCAIPNAEVILLSPQGQTFNQSWATKLSMSGEFFLVCGRYRGIDERFTERYITTELSIGDYILSGGEAAAIVVIDSVTRLIPGVMNDFESGLEDSFQDGVLDCPWYTRPPVFEGLNVPEVLMGGNHEEIKRWRREQSLKRTRERRPDLLNNMNENMKKQVKF